MSKNANHLEYRIDSHSEIDCFSNSATPELFSWFANLTKYTGQISYSLEFRDKKYYGNWCYISEPTSRINTI